MMKAEFGIERADLIIALNKWPEHTVRAMVAGFLERRKLTEEFADFLEEIAAAPKPIVEDARPLMSEAVFADDTASP